MPSYYPLTSDGPQTRAGRRPLTSEATEPTPIPTKKRLSLPIRDENLKQYIPHIRTLVRASNELSRKYSVAIHADDPQPWAEDAAEDYAPDAGVFAQYTTKGSKKLPPAYATGVDPEGRGPSQPTLADLTIKTSADLSGVAAPFLLGEVDERLEGSTPIHAIQPLRLQSKEALIARNLAAKRMMEGAD
jgi:hypothetical protein